MLSSCRNIYTESPIITRWALTGIYEALFPIHCYCKKQQSQSIPTQALPKCSRKHAHTGTAEMQPQACPHRHCRNAAASMPTQALPKCIRKHTHTGIAEMHPQACPHRHCRNAAASIPTLALPKCSRTGECPHRHCRNAAAPGISYTGIAGRNERRT